MSDGGCFSKRKRRRERYEVRDDVMHRGNSNPNRPGDPNRSPAKRVRFGKEEVRSTDEEKATAFAIAFFEPCEAHDDVVPVVGLEPTPCCQERILSPSRLPVHHTGVLFHEYISSA